MKFALILGTRPEIVKMSPVIRECELLGLDFFVLHTGQHYSYNMDRVFFEQLGLPEAQYNLDVGSGLHGEQTGRMLAGIEKILGREAPEVVLVQGDTNTVLAGALAASKLGIKVGHVEAGLRSYDKTMPEETNRVLADHCSDYLFAPTKESQHILLGEGIAAEQVFMVGNTVVDAVYQNLELAQSKSMVLDELHLAPKEYVLATSHRQENVDCKDRFVGLIRGLKMVQRECGVPLVYPIHPRAKKQLELFGLSTDGLTLVEPLDYLSFLQLESKAKLVLTDSGGVQEETCILNVPCVTLRDNTERPETLTAGSNILAGTDPNKILKAAQTITAKPPRWKNPFGDGTSASKILQILLSNLC
ncbi:MAG: UDP-N-acetylglucosamine 2-epimerase (non-hydrolyzing) [Candidatus Bathyarchaeota archaeon]|nr:UDP-N-acetylglucosamine 2-epimerase (non-hydrolyzing) [Candidatus Bathyarchaeota archaeon]